MHSNAKFCTPGSPLTKWSEFPGTSAFVVEALLPNLKLLAKYVWFSQSLEGMKVSRVSVSWLGVTGTPGRKEEEEEGGNGRSPLDAIHQEHMNPEDRLLEQKSPRETQTAQQEHSSGAQLGSGQSTLENEIRQPPSN